MLLWPVFAPGGWFETGENTADNSTVEPVFQALYYLENKPESDRVATTKKRYTE